VAEKKQIVPEGLTLRPYQKKGVKFCLKRSRSIIGDVMGLGKTPQAVVYSNAIEAQHIVVIGPAVARYNWLHEFETWGTQDYNITVVDKGNVKVELDNRPTVIIISYHLVLQEKWYQFLSTFLGSAKPSLLICDEAHNLGSWSAKWTRKILLKLSPKASHLLLLTGTPMRNKVDTLHPLFSACDPKMWGTLKEFREKYMFPVPDPYVGTKYIGARNVPDLREKSKTFMIRRFKKNVLKELPSKMFNNVYLDVPSKLAEHSIEGMEQLLKAVERGDKVNFSDNTGDLAKLRRQLGLAKLPATIDWLDEFFENEPDTQLGLFCHHTEVAKTLSSALHKKKIKSGEIIGETTPKRRNENIKAFQDGELQVLVLNIQAGGTAINLQNAHHVAFVEVDYSPANMDQAVNRFHRMGQKNKVQVYFLLAEKSIETKIIQIIRRKIKEMEAIVG